MAKGTLGQVVKRAISDAAFRRQLQSDPEGALKGFDLTGDERAALRSGDASKLSTLGIDQRMSKTFEMGAGAAAVSKMTTGSDASLGMNIPISDEVSSGDGLVSGARANDALIGDAGGSVRSAVTDAERLGQLNASFEGSDSVISGVAGNDSAARLAQLNASFEGSDSVISGGTGTDSAARLAQLNASFEGADSVVAGGTGTDSAARLAQLNASFEGADSVVAGGSASGESSLDISGNTRDASLISSDAGGRQTDAFVTADEAGNNVVAGGSASGESSLDISGNTRDASLISSDAGGRQTDAFVTADEAGNNVVAGGSASGESSLDISGNTRDASLISSDAAGRQTDAFITADEASHDYSARITAPDPDTALAQRDALGGDALANPDGYERPEVTDS